MQDKINYIFKEQKRIEILIATIAILTLFDVLTTLFGVHCTNSFVEEMGPLAGPDYSINNLRVAGSLVFGVLVLIYVFIFNLLQYKIIEWLLKIWLIRCVFTVIINSYAIYVLLSPFPY